MTTGTAVPLPSNFIVRREHQSLRTMTVASIRRAILSLHYKPGERLTERELCGLTDVSRSLMREALRDLEAEGLITNVQHRGPAVQTVTLIDAREIYEVRRALEPLAAHLFVANATDRHIEQLKAAAVQCKTTMVEGRVYDSVVTLESFYRILYEGAGNGLASSLGRIVYAKAGLLRAVTFDGQSQADMRQSIRRISEITGAARRRDAEALVDACRKQIERSAKVAAKVLGR